MLLQKKQYFIILQNIYTEKCNVYIAFIRIKNIGTRVLMPPHIILRPLMKCQKIINMRFVGSVLQSVKPCLRGITDGQLIFYLID